MPSEIPKAEPPAITPSMSPQQAAQLSPTQVELVRRYAEQGVPGDTLVVLVNNLLNEAAGGSTKIDQPRQQSQRHESPPIKDHPPQYGFVGP
jgi:hypothetical protein